MKEYRIGSVLSNSRRKNSYRKLYEKYKRQKYPGSKYRTGDEHKDNLV